MVTVEQALQELDDRIEIWEDYNKSHPSGEIGITWRDVMAFARDIIREREKNREYLRGVLFDLERLDPGDMVSVDAVKEILAGFHFGGVE